MFYVHEAVVNNSASWTFFMLFPDRILQKKHGKNEEQ